MNRRPTPETDKAKCKFTSLFGDDEDAYWVPLKVARCIELKRDELKSDLEFRRGLFQLQEQQLNEVRAERDKHHEDADAFLDKWSKAQERAIDAERERDAERALADRLAELVQRDRDQYGGQLIDSDCDCSDCEYLGPIDAALAAWKKARNEI